MTRIDFFFKMARDLKGILPPPVLDRLLAEEENCKRYHCAGHTANTMLSARDIQHGRTHEQQLESLCYTEGVFPFGWEAIKTTIETIYGEEYRRVEWAQNWQDPRLRRAAYMIGEDVPNGQWNKEYL